MKVRTTDGVLHTGGKGGGQGQKLVPLTQEEADTICKRANKEAEKLDLNVRYEVTED